jgi:uncharacterized protein (DUF1501 family)
MLNRRHLLQSWAGAAAAAAAPLATACRSPPRAAPASRSAAAGNRLVLVVLRPAAWTAWARCRAGGDGAFAAARGALARRPGRELLPAARAPSRCTRRWSRCARSPGRQEALVVHAVGLPYRERSHFDAQQVLESGGTQPFQLSTGWLARALAGQSARGLALNTAVPLVLRGPGEIDTWAPSTGPEPAPDLVTRLQRMYSGRRACWRRRWSARATCARRPTMPVGAMAGAGAGGRAAAVALARRAAEFIALPAGPQAAVLEFGGWDTHANQAAPNGALANGLRTLDAALAGHARGADRAAGRRRLGRTVVLVVDRSSAASGGQRHDGHRPRLRRRGLRAGRGGARRARAGRLAGPGAGRALRGPRPAHHHRPARGVPQRAGRPPAGAHGARWTRRCSPTPSGSPLGWTAAAAEAPALPCWRAAALAQGAGGSCRRQGGERPGPAAGSHGSRAAAMRAAAAWCAAAKACAWRGHVGQRGAGRACSGFQPLPAQRATAAAMSRHALRCAGGQRPARPPARS